MKRLTRRSLLAALVPPSPRPLVIAHRAAHREHPENSLPAIEAAIALGCDYVELDVRTTIDGHLILHHDATIAGAERIADLTLSELRRRSPIIPTFDEALAKLTGRCRLYLDAKQITAARILDTLERHRMLAHTVVYGSLPLLAELAAAGHPELAMPEAVNAATLRQSLATLRPTIIAFDRRDFTDELIALARQAGKGIFVDRLGPDDTAAAWDDALRRGATGIQTDRPAELIAHLKRA